MKNGFKLALLMAMLVALMASASATAPIIGTLPTVIVGDTGDISGEGTAALHLLRYNNAIDLASKITSNDEGGAAKVRVMYTSSEGTLKIGKPAIVGALTAGEVTALTTTGAEPAAAKQLSAATSLLMSLAFDVKGGMTDVAAATPDANGSLESAITAANILGAVNTKSITLYAVDDDVVTSNLVSAPKSFDVYAMLGQGDSAGLVKTPLRNYDFTTGAQGWTFGGVTAPGFTAATKLETGGIGFAGSTGANVFSDWQSPNPATDAANAVDASNMGGQVFEAIATLSGNGADATRAPGFRFLFASAGFNHMGGFQVDTPNTGTGSTASNSPFTATNKEVRMYWAVPAGLTEYGDGEYLDHVANAGYDMRDYIIMFDVVKQADATANGSLLMESFVVNKMQRPGDSAPVIKWSATDTAFTGWAAANGGQTGFDASNIAVAAGNIKLQMGTGNSAYGATYPSAVATGYPDWTSGKLMRTTYNIQAAAGLSPDFRLITLGYTKSATAPVLLPVMWGETVNPSNLRAAIAKTAHATLPGQPAAGGSTIECYLWTQNAGTENGCLQPFVDIAMPDYTAIGNGWSKPTFAQINSIAMEYPTEQP